jgi:hypothetical protein
MLSQVLTEQGSGFLSSIRNHFLTQARGGYLLDQKAAAPERPIWVTTERKPTKDLVVSEYS